MVRVGPVVEEKRKGNYEANLEGKERWWIYKYANEGHFFFK